MSAPPSQRLPNWHQVWAVLATGLPLAILAVGCLNAQRVPPDTARRPSQQAPARPTIEPTGAARNKTPSSWKPLKTVRKWNSIVLHHTATEAGSVASIHANHLQRTTGGKPWLGIGYHFVVDRAGRAWEARPISYQGAHVKAHNEGNIGILCLGNYEVQVPTQAQMRKLEELIVTLRTRYRISPTSVSTHKELCNNCTLCPGRNLQRAVVRSRSARRFG